MTQAVDGRVTSIEYGEVARWVIEEIHRRGSATRTELAAEVRDRFGARMVNEDATAFDDKFLATFRRAHAGSLRWIQAGQYWQSVR